MNWTMSGWSMFRITIFAARRVFPPLLITPAKASKPFMKLTGPDAIPPPLSVSLLPRSVEKFVPVPEPHLKSIPSVRVKPMIDSMLSLTELMKHAEHCGFGCTPTLNHTGELNAIFCSTSRWVRSSRKASRDSASAKYPHSSPHCTMVFTTRPISCRTDPSRCAVPGFPWKYLLVTMFVAVCDQLFGTSTSSWRKIVTPFSFPISAVRFSHSTASKGDFFPSVKYRRKVRPFPAPFAVFSAAASVAGEFPLNACFTVAIRPSALLGPHSRGVTPPFYSSASYRGAALRFRAWAEVNATLIRSDRESGQRKKADCKAVALKFQRKAPTPCRWPVVRTQPNSTCSASCTGAGQVLRARFFRLEPGPLRGLTRTLIHPRLGPSGASTSPESGFAVSTEENFLSREKRKMWATFSYCVYL